MATRFLPKLPKVFSAPVDEEAKAKSELENRMLKMESEIGGKLFGPVPKGHKRYFFCLDSHTWVWHEDWKENGQHYVISTRYDFRPTGVIKIQDGQPNREISKQEARNLYKAIELYEQKVEASYMAILDQAS